MEIRIQCTPDTILGREKNFFFGFKQYTGTLLSQY